jgi:hypothetical protein
MVGAIANSVQNAAKLFRLFSFACLLLFGTSAFSVSKADNTPLSVVVAPDVLVDYELFMRGRPGPDPTTTGMSPSRDALEVAVLVRALRAGGVDNPIEYVVSPSLERHVFLLRSGGVALSAAMINLADLNGEVGVVHEIDFDSGGGSQIVGLYASPENKLVDAVQSLEDFENLSAVSNRAWRADWRALEAANLKDVVSVSDWATMCRIVMLGRVDFLLAPFRPDGSNILPTAAGDLMRLEGFGVILSAERRFVVSASHPEHDALSEALEKGFNLLEAADDYWVRALRRASAPSAVPENTVIINPTRGRQAPKSTSAYQ